MYSNLCAIISHHPLKLCITVLVVNNGHFDFVFSVKGLCDLADMSQRTTDACLMRRRVIERILCRR